MKRLFLVVTISLLTMSAFPQTDNPNFFGIHVVDENTGRGVPLVELSTTNALTYVTDSQGWIALYEPGLMGHKVHFMISSHGYEYPKDGFGYRGVAILVTPGGRKTIKIKRINIAEHLYRITGQGIYRDSIILGEAVPIENPITNGGVMGQDSVVAAEYRDKLYWFWGDTSRAAYPLGNFAVSGAISSLPRQVGLDPSLGVNLEYFVNDKGFCKSMCKLPDPGMVWIFGLMTLKDNAGKTRLLAHYSRMKSLGERMSHGLVVYNDDRDAFDHVMDFDLDIPFYPRGQPFKVRSGNEDYYYFPVTYPLAVNMRVKAKWEDVINPMSYQIYTKSANDWHTVDDICNSDPSKLKGYEQVLKKDRESKHLYDIETGKEVLMHSGSVYWNAFRQRWVMIAEQYGGETSMIGELWYAEADTPTGPWVYTRKIVTHDKYSFYNIKQHPYFDQDNGRLIYFEGTYTQIFSGNPVKTPRYDYNQIMYRLDLGDERLYLPVPVYKVRVGHRYEYMMRERVESDKLWNEVEAVPFLAMQPERALKGAIPIGNREKVLFRILNIDEIKENKIHLLQPLYVFRKADGSLPIYQTNKKPPGEEWKRTDKPLGAVWRNPHSELMLDRDAKPVRE
jgi:hypothetical protein